MAKPRIIFMGTPDFAAHALSVLSENGCDIAAVVTSPDKPAGRGLKMQPSAVKIYAGQKGYPVLQPLNLKDPDFIETLRVFSADLFVVVAFRMLPEAVWSMPPLGTINLHASLLPQYRGAAPIQRAIINGETLTGVTTFFIEKEIDTGKIIQSREVAIGAEENAGSLHDKLMHTGAELLLETIRLISSGRHKALEQAQVFPEDGILKAAPKIFKKDCKIHWALTGKEIFNLVRGLSPYPSAWTFLQTQEGKSFSVKIFSSAIKPFSTKNPAPGTLESDGKDYLRIASSDAWVYLYEIQPEGKKRMDIQSFLRGIQDGSTLSVPISLSES
jgi:methionyl-tRNA formyltransferase